MKEQANVAIVGAGAAGLAAAVVAGEMVRERSGRVVLCEANDRVGRSILATGNGRCNFSNALLGREAVCDASALERFYRNADFVAQVFTALESLSQFRRDASEQEHLSGTTENAVLRFFADHGLVWREEGEGRLYPLANKASSVLDVLRAAVEAAGVETLTEFSVRTIAERPEGGYLLVAENGRDLHADRVIVVTGGSIGDHLVGSLGLSSVEQRPVLGPLAVTAGDKRITKQLDNIRVKARATLLRKRDRVTSVVRCESGEVLFRAYGLSGIAIFDLSRDARAGDELSLCLLPSGLMENASSFLAERAVRLRREGGEVATYEGLLRGLALPQVAQAVAERAQVRLGEPCSATGVERLASVLVDWRFTVEGIGDTRQCQVMRGGVDVSELDPATLEAVSHLGLYVAGEAVDVDAACGGFNLHWAWASGILAGRAAAQGALSASRRGR